MPSSASGTKPPPTGAVLDLNKEKERMELLSHFTGSNDSLLRLLLLCRQHGEVATEAALEAATKVVEEENSLAQKALAVEKTKKLRTEQLSCEAQVAENKRKTLLLEAENAKMEAKRQEEEARQKLEAAMEAEEVRNQASKKAAEAAEAAHAAEVLRRNMEAAPVTPPLQPLDSVMILGLKIFTMECHQGVAQHAN